MKNLNKHPGILLSYIKVIMLQAIVRNRYHSPTRKIPWSLQTTRNTYTSPLLSLCRAKISLSVHLSRTGLSHRPGHISPATPDAQSLTTTDDNRIDRPLGALSSWPIVAKRVLLLLPGTQQL